MSRPCFGPASLILFLPTLFGKRGIFTRSPDREYFVPSHFDLSVLLLTLIGHDTVFI